MEVASPDPLSQIFPAMLSIKRKLLQKVKLRSNSLLWGSLCSLCGQVLGQLILVKAIRGHSQGEMKVEAIAVTCEVTLLPPMVFNQDPL